MNPTMIIVGLLWVAISIITLIFAPKSGTEPLIHYYATLIISQIWLAGSFLRITK